MPELSTTQLLQIITQYVPQMVARSVRVPTIRLGSVAQDQQDTISAVVLIDGDDQTTEVLSAAGHTLLAGDRVVVQFYPPHGAVIVGTMGQDNVALGALARTKITDTTTAIGPGGYDVNQTATVTLTSNRRLRVSAGVNMTTPGGGGAYLILKCDGVTFSDRVAQMNLLPGNGAKLVGWDDIEPGPGTHLFRLGIVGIGTTIDLASGTDPGFIAVDDVGRGGRSIPLPP